MGPLWCVVLVVLVLKSGPNNNMGMEAINLESCTSGEQATSLFLWGGDGDGGGGGDDDVEEEEKDDKTMETRKRAVKARERGLANGANK